MNITFIGGGNMGRAIIGGLIAKGIRARDITAVELDAGARTRLATEFGVAVAAAAGDELRDADVVVMAAAVADYTPVAAAVGKIAKAAEPLTVTLEPTKDILAELGRAAARRATPPVLVGFAAETGDLLEKAREKRARKGADFIVANDVSQPGSGFDVDTNAVTIIGADGEQVLPQQSKSRVAEAILDRVEQILRSRVSTPSRA